MACEDNPLDSARSAYQPKLPSVFDDLTYVALMQEPLQAWKEESKEVLDAFPLTAAQPVLRCVKGIKAKAPLPQRVGVVFSGGQAPGGHNVISGLYDALKKRNGASRLFGFLNGSSGLMKEMHYLEIKESILDLYRNQGGFDLLGSGRTKIETPEQFEAVKKMVWALELHALVIIGGDDSNTNAAHLAEYFLREKVPCQVIGVPKTIDGDLRNPYIELSFGFDTASKTYAEIVGNLARDALSAKKYYYFIKLMGRSASHITLECALQTCPNLALISEEVAQEGKTLEQIVSELCALICKRAEQGKNYGVFLIPEGLLEFTKDCQQLIQELNKLVASAPKPKEEVLGLLTAESAHCYEMLSPTIQNQLLMDRDAFGNVQVSKIETERLLISLVEKELAKRKQAGSYAGKFAAQPFFCGYEGRSAYPSNFDCDYCYALGYTAAVLIERGATGYIACIQNLKEDPKAWKPGGCPLQAMIHFEERHGKKVAVIKKALVELDSPVFQAFAAKRAAWSIEDNYRFPGPIQFYGPSALTELVTFTLKLD